MTLSIHMTTAILQFKPEAGKSILACTNSLYLRFFLKKLFQHFDCNLFFIVNLKNVIFRVIITHVSGDSVITRKNQISKTV